MPKVVIVHHCSKCPYGNSSYQEPDACFAATDKDHKHFRIFGEPGDRNYGTYPKEIPDWCPLPDTEESLS